MPDRPASDRPAPDVPVPGADGGPPPLPRVRHTHAAGCQVFNYLGWTWCITHALALVAAEPRLATLAEADISNLDEKVGLAPPPEGGVPLVSATGLDPGYAMTTDLALPLLVVTLRSADGEHDYGPMIIDGWHRVYHGRRTGRDRLPALHLADAVGNAARIFPSPPRRR